jgi:hypothetical protein
MSDGPRMKTMVRLASGTVAVLGVLLLPGRPASAGWWCGPGQWSCELAQELCEAHAHARCAEYSDVIVLDGRPRSTLPGFSMIRRLVPDSYFQFPLLAQCEEARKRAARVMGDGRSVGRCRSYRVMQAEAMSKVRKYARSVESCGCITPERIQEMADRMMAWAGKMAMASYRNMLTAFQQGQNERGRSVAGDLVNERWNEAIDQGMASIDDAGMWDVFLALGLFRPFEPPAPPDPDFESWCPQQDGRLCYDPPQELPLQRGLLLSARMKATALTDEDFQKLRWAARHGSDPDARVALGKAVAGVKAVEKSEREVDGISRSLVWAESHLTDPRARCIVELLDQQRKRIKADLAKIEAKVRRKP